MNTNRLPDYIEHMQQAAIDACTFVEGLCFTNFLEDKHTQQAVIMSLIIIGEAATKVMDSYTESIWGIDDTSTIESPSPNDLSSSAATFTPGQLNCNAVNDGACATNNLFIFYGPNNDYAAGLCKATIDDYTDWYLPAVCELGPFGSTGSVGSYPSLTSSQLCTAGTTNIQNQLASPNLVGFSAGSYWSSTEYSSNPANSAWFQALSFSGSDSQADASKNTSPQGVRCVRALSL